MADESTSTKELIQHWQDNLDPTFSLENRIVSDIFKVLRDLDKRMSLLDDQIQGLTKTI